MSEIKLCECGCGGKTTLSNWWKSRYNKDIMPEGWNRYNRYIKGHSIKNAHRIKAEIILGHPIPKGVQVHHHGRPSGLRIWGVKDIVICENQEYHGLLHRRENAYFAVNAIK